MVRPPAPPVSPPCSSGPSPGPTWGAPAAPSPQPGLLPPGPHLRCAFALCLPFPVANAHSWPLISELLCLWVNCNPCLCVTSDPTEPQPAPLVSGCPALVPDLPSALALQSDEPEGRSYSTLTTVREIETQTELLSPGRAEEEEDRDEGIKQAMNHFVQENGTLRAKPTGNGIYINGRGHLV